MKKIAITLVTLIAIMFHIFLIPLVAMLICNGIIFPEIQEAFGLAPFRFSYWFYIGISAIIYLSKTKISYDEKKQ